MKLIKIFIPLFIFCQCFCQNVFANSNISNYDSKLYINNMETDLDKVADGKEVWYELLDKFYKDFEPLVKEAFEEMKKEEPEVTGEKCPLCGKDLVYRYGKFGKFVACSGYPECKYIPKEKKETTIICKCPKCGGNIIVKKTRKNYTKRNRYRGNC